MLAKVLPFLPPFAQRGHSHLREEFLKPNYRAKTKLKFLPAAFTDRYLRLATIHSRNVIDNVIRIVLSGSETRVAIFAQKTKCILNCANAEQVVPVLATIHQLLLWAPLQVCFFSFEQFFLLRCARRQME